MSSMNDSDPVPQYPDRSGTVLETDEDIRQALLGMKPPPQGSGGGPNVAFTPLPEAAKPASPWRPTSRPPVPVLTVFDDGRTEGEVVRIRGPRFTIGRTEGDLRFPMDGRVSSKHVEITHQVVGGLHRWVVTDLQSTHGLYVRVSKTALADNAEFLVGQGRYRFEANQPESEATIDHVPGEPAPGETQGWAGGVSAFRPPALTELLGKEIGNRVLLVKGEYWIGSGPSCPVGRPDDPFCDPKHARLYRSAKGSWHVENNKTHNGLWLRMTQITADSVIQFQVGEQRFKLKVG